ncbi:MAG: tRNA pseudouridine(38-40) synthase TruA [Oleiphilus sp.]|nr:MAG: tRNA pseudouridine(38-40) synthase TruA [Oleiphilus sp.]
MSEVKNTAGDTSRVALCLSYNGQPYHGWQAQRADLPTVQKYLEASLSKVADEPIEVVCAGRTDKAVHASHQVVHFDTRARRSSRSWVFGCNSHLPREISVTWASPVSSEFHARYSAQSRRYHYCIFNHPTRPANFSGEMTWFHYPLDEAKMHEAAQCLVGEHDFSSFRATGCQSRSPMRFLEHVDVFRVANMVLIDIKGNAFLHHMVRNIAGVLLEIGAGNAPVAWCREVLEARDRKCGGVTAPPNGLFLSQVEYPDEFGIPREIGAPGWLHALMCAAGRVESHNPDLWQLAFRE